jgi:hypothetical protein
LIIISSFFIVFSYIFGFQAIINPFRFQWICCASPLCLQNFCRRSSLKFSAMILGTLLQRWWEVPGDARCGFNHRGLRRKHGMHFPSDGNKLRNHLAS